MAELAYFLILPLILLGMLVFYHMVVDIGRYYFELFGKGNDNPLRYSCLENSMDGGAW